MLLRDLYGSLGFFWYSQNSFRKILNVSFFKFFQVQCFPLYSVLMALENPHIDYFSLDIEGAELPVLKSLPWNEISMTVLDVEINHAGKIFPGSREEIQNFIASHGYQFLNSNGGIHTAATGNANF